MTEENRAGEVIDACTTNFTAQCYELYNSPPLGGLVKTQEKDIQLFGVVYKVLTAGIEPGRKPIARGKDDLSEDEIYRTNPQLLKLLKSEFSVLVTGYKKDGRFFHYLAPRPAHIHSPVFGCVPEEIKGFSKSMDFLDIILKSRLEIPVEQLVGAVLRQMALVYGAEKHTFLVNAGKELAALLSSDYTQLKAILKGLRNDAVG
ncbi:MAG: hypothetical protein JXA46_12360 [Dehalococcoidales bacterium]|nr:hypothetical protein [Dehalococcoidales bacterium]